MCGFSQSTLVTLPFRVTVFFASNSAEKEWCANIEAAESNPTANTASLAFIENLPDPFLFLNYCLAASGLDDPANTVLPSANLTEVALQVFEASLASVPLMLIRSPFFRSFLVQPLRVSVLGGPPSHCQDATAPVLSSFTSR